MSKTCSFIYDGKKPPLIGKVNQAQLSNDVYQSIINNKLYFVKDGYPLNCEFDLSSLSDKDIINFYSKFKSLTDNATPNDLLNKITGLDHKYTTIKKDI